MSCDVQWAIRGDPLCPVEWTGLPYHRLVYWAYIHDPHVNVPTAFFACFSHIWSSTMLIFVPVQSISGESL